MTRDWFKEWDTEQAEVDDLLAMFRKADECEHEWQKIETIDAGMALSWLDAVCERCGTTRATVSAAVMEQLEGLLDGEEENTAGVAGLDRGADGVVERPDHDEGAADEGEGNP